MYIILIACSSLFSYIYNIYRIFQKGLHQEYFCASTSIWIWITTLFIFQLYYIFTCKEKEYTCKIQIIETLYKVLCYLRLKKLKFFWQQASLKGTNTLLWASWKLSNSHKKLIFHISISYIIITILIHVYGHNWPMIPGIPPHYHLPCWASMTAGSTWARSALTSCCLTSITLVCSIKAVCISWDITFLASASCWSFTYMK